MFLKGLLIVLFLSFLFLQHFYFLGTDKTVESRNICIVPVSTFLIIEVTVLLAHSVLFLANPRVAIVYPFRFSFTPAIKMRFF